MRFVWWVLGSVALLRARRQLRLADRMDAKGGWDRLDDTLDHEMRARVLQFRAEEFFQRMRG